MNRFIFAVTVALGLFLGTADRADAQVIYGYNTYNPYTGTVVTNRTVITPYTAQSQSSYFNPWFGYSGQQVQYRNAWGTVYNRGYGTTPYYGGYNYGYYTPGFGTPYYSVYQYRW